MRPLSILWDWIFPPRCAICTHIIPVGVDDFLCPGCRKDIPYHKPPFCRKCGIPVGRANSVCDRCFRETFAFGQGLAAFPYEAVRDAIRCFKFDGYESYGKGLGMLMAEFGKQYYTQSYDLLIPVPISKKKKRQRGFNQTEILSVEIMKVMGIPMNEKLLLRQRDTTPQNQLDVKERKRNIEGAFALSQEGTVEGKRILLIDDIFTTGNTVNECARTLLMNGAAEVDVFALSAANKKKEG